MAYYPGKVLLLEHLGENLIFYIKNMDHRRVYCEIHAVFKVRYILKWDSLVFLWCWGPLNKIRYLTIYS